eukprot:5731187-Amphidinium_carterae.1
MCIGWRKKPHFGGGSAKPRVPLLLVARFLKLAKVQDARSAVLTPMVFGSTGASPTRQHIPPASCKNKMITSRRRSKKRFQALGPYPVYPKYTYIASAPNFVPTFFLR